MKNSLIMVLKALNNVKSNFSRTQGYAKLLQYVMKFLTLLTASKMWVTCKILRKYSNDIKTMK